jgi:hypothetical protein
VGALTDSVTSLHQRAAGAAPGGDGAPLHNLGDHDEAATVWHAGQTADGARGLISGYAQASMEHAAYRF